MKVRDGGREESGGRGRREKDRKMEGAEGDWGEGEALP